MSSSSNAIPPGHLSNVTFSPISSEVLHVRIKKMSSEEDIPKSTSPSRLISLRKTVSGQSKNRNHAKSTMTDQQNTTSASSVSGQRKNRNHTKSTMTYKHDTTSASSQTVRKEQKVTADESHDIHDASPCLKHAAENISRKASSIPSEKISLCNNCSKSMLSYIFLVQDFLDSLAKEIIGSETSHCLQCARQEIRNDIAKSHFKDDSNIQSRIPNHSGQKSSVDSTPQNHPDHKYTGTQQKEISSARRSGNKVFKGKSYQQEVQREDIKGIANATHQYNENKKREQQNSFTYSVDASNVNQMKTHNVPKGSDERPERIDTSNPESHTIHKSSATHDSFNQQWTPVGSQNFYQPVENNQAVWSSPREDLSEKHRYTSENSNTQHLNHNKQSYETFGGDSPEFRTLKERIQPNYQPPPTNVPDNPSQSDSNSNLFEGSPSLYNEDLDGIISTLSTAEREVYDSARGRAGWEGFTENQEKLVIPSGNLITSEAFVTSCRNNAEAIGCLVLGTSLLLCRTSRTLCVLVSEGVSTAFRNAFSAVFQVVQLVRSLDSLGTTKLALLEQPELGVTFEKLNIWRLFQFTKCVYLNPDTLVIQNCDELFCREELSAVPDIGWPDCFNSGVFVYSPSVHTFWQLLEFSEKQGSYDGGDQGLLNSYFNSWSSDISKKLSFIYNLMANVSYTYSPAFKQFGRDVKIVQFHGSFKPWHVKFFTKSGQISPSSPVHPTYVQFVHIWINIFRITVLRLLSQEIQCYAASQEVISAVEMLRFFPLPTESESDFFLTPPSVRLRLAEKKLYRFASLPISEARRRKSAEFFRHVDTEGDIPETTDILDKEEEKTESDGLEKPKAEVAVVVAEAAAVEEPSAKETADDSVLGETEQLLKEDKVVAKKEKRKDENALPGSEIGDYQGMKAWEQGRMDYEGTASSDNVIKRLQFLMNPKPK